MLASIVEFIAQHQRFAITSHSRPDGDSLGSSLALGQVFRALGKRARIVHADPPPAPYRFLPGAQEIEIGNRLQGDFEAVFVLECNRPDRTGLTGLERHYLINIDHHADAGDYGGINWIDPTAGALGEMIYLLALGLKVPVSAAMATNLFVAVSTDTGSFQFPNTTARTFEVSSRLVALGADPAAIAQRVYLSQPLSKVRLLGKVLETLELHRSGQIASMTLNPAMLEATGARADETEGIVTHALSVDSVRLVAFFREESNRTRVSLRSKEALDVGSVAKLFGGGGHRNASGFTLFNGRGVGRAQVLTELEKLLDEKNVR